MHKQASLLTIIVSAGTWLVAPGPFFGDSTAMAQNVFSYLLKLHPNKATVHALISRADFSAEAKKLSLLRGSDLPQVLAQVANVV